ncbi:LysR family transcriptional regulator [uncultured Bartonella sp.]|uniref:LysR family transcriptional regulator n=1 Tax=uncultured Bartonella sp. TaxID=104108 RepID=UPI002620A615|nr:LysR family transcriptional regulator [uncultured Bartonella sp.]
MDRQQLSHLVIFEAVVKEGSFRAAARRLNIAPSAVSYAIGKLEESLAVQLFNRTTRSLNLSEEGKVLIRQTAAALRMIEDGFNEAKAAHNKVSGKLRINTGYSAAKFLIAPYLGEFTKSFPDIVLDLVIDNRFVDIVESGFDAGIRIHEHVEKDMVAAKIGGDLRSVLVATPHYFDNHSRPQHPRDLKSHKAILYRFNDKRTYVWEFERGRKKMIVTPPEQLIVNNHQLAIDAVFQHIGLAYLFEDYVKDELKKGQLVQVMEDWTPAFSGFYIYYPQQKMRAALRAFIDFFINKNRHQKR